MITGETHGANAASSSLHSKPSAASLALNAKRADCSGEMSCGASVSLVVNGSGVGVAVGCRGERRRGRGGRGGERRRSAGCGAAGAAARAGRARAP